MKRIIVAFLFIVLAFSVFAGEGAKPSLKSVMKNLGKSMDDLNYGIFYEDFKKIEEAAANIADHPKPKSQLPTIIKTLNIRMPRFKSFDSKVHDSAKEIVELAQKKDMNGILKKHKVIMKNCVACHSQFRSEVSRALSK